MGRRQRRCHESGISKMLSHGYTVIRYELPRAFDWFIKIDAIEYDHAASISCNQKITSFLYHVFGGVAGHFDHIA